jgi:DNA-binding transcriptional regulator YiaG
MGKYYIPSPAEVRQARIESGLTQRECADLVCSAPTTWQAWEQGNNAMPAGLWKLFLILVEKTFDHYTGCV